MSVNTEKTAFIKSLKAREKELAEVSKEEVGGGFLTDEDIINLLGLSETKTQVATKISRVRYGNDKNKNPYFSFNYVITDGEHKGLSVSRFVGLGGKTKADRQKGMKQLCGTLQRLDIDTTSWPPGKVVENAVSAADQLTEEKPPVIIGLSTYNRQDKSKGLSVDIISLGAPSSNGAAPKARAAKTAKTAAAFAQMGKEADDDGEQSHAALEAAAKRHGLDPDEYGTWEELGAELDSLEEDDDDIDYESYVDPDSYGAMFNTGEGEVEVSVTAYDPTTKLFTVVDENDVDYECEFSDLDFGE